MSPIPKGVLQQYVQSTARVRHHRLRVALVQRQIARKVPYRLQVGEHNADAKVRRARLPRRDAAGRQRAGHRRLTCIENMSALGHHNSHPDSTPTRHAPKMSSIPRSRSSTYGRRCGTVVLGACGFEQSFMHFSVGRNFASKLNALSVWRCRRMCHADSSR